MTTSKTTIRRSVVLAIVNEKPDIGYLVTATEIADALTFYGYSEAFRRTVESVLDRLADEGYLDSTFGADDETYYGFESAVTLNGFLSAFDH